VHPYWEWSYAPTCLGQLVAITPRCMGPTARVRISTSTARTMLGYLFVRGRVHAMACARALETLTGVEMSKLLPIPNIGNALARFCTGSKGATSGADSAGPAVALAF